MWLLLENLISMLKFVDMTLEVAWRDRLPYQNLASDPYPSKRINRPQHETPYCIIFIAKHKTVVISVH